MKAEDSNVIVAVFALLAAVVTTAAATVKGPPNPPVVSSSWVTRSRSFIATHLQLMLACIAVCLWLVPVALYIMERVREWSAAAEHVSEECAGIQVAGYPSCAHNIWLETHGTCEPPTSVFKPSTGSDAQNLRLYCIQLDLKNKPTSQLR